MEQGMYSSRQRTSPVLFFLFAFLAVAFLGLSWFIKSHGSNFPLNITIYNYFHSVRTGIADWVAILICLTGDKKALIPAACLFVLWLACKRQYRLAIFWFLLIFITAAAAYTLKAWVASPRPGEMTTALKNFSFPSGHVLLITSYLIFLYRTLSENFSSCNRKLMALTCAALILAQITARLFLDSHWFTDVLGGVLLGMLCSFGVSYFYHQKVDVIKNPREVLLAFIFIFFAVMSGYMGVYHHEMQETYQLQNGVAHELLAVL